jgi:predicted nucleic acid-binding protein
MKPTPIAPTPAAHMLYVAEPPAAYLARPALVVDCSVLAAVLFEEASRDEALARLSGRTLHAPTLIDHEIASVALKKHAQGWPADSISLALADYAEQALELHRSDVAAQCELAHRYGLSAYDAAYLWLAADMKAPLATFDRKLGEAAQRHLAALP